MRCLSQALGQLPEYADLLRSVNAGRTPAVATGLSHIHKALLIQTLCHDTGRRALVVVSDDSEAAALAADLTALGCRPAVLPTRDLSLREVAGFSRDYEHARIGTLSRLRTGQADVCLCSAEAARLRTMPPDILAQRSLTLREGDALPPQELAERLMLAGYVRCDAVEGPGQYARRGDIFDLYPPDSDSPVRIEYWGDDIDSLHRFDPLSQRRTDRLETLSLTPAAEVLPGDPTAFAEAVHGLRNRLAPDSPATVSLAQAEDRLRSGQDIGCADRFLPLLYREATVLDYTDGWLTFVSESARVGEHSRSLDARQREEMAALLESGVLCKGLDAYYLDDAAFLARLQQAGALLLDTFARGHYAFPVPTQIHFTLRQLSVWNGSYALLKEDAAPLIERGFAVLVLAGTERAALTLTEDLQKDGFRADAASGEVVLRPGGFTVAPGTLSAGFELPGAKVALITHGRIATRRKSHVRKSKDAFTSLEQLHPGDYVVHAAHGIGVFEGVRSMTVEGVTKDYLRIHYAKEDVLYVPVTQLDLLSKYIGAGEPENVRLHRLGGSEWQKTRSRVKAAVRDMAKELIALYAQRMAQPGFAFSADSDFQADFERRFEYEETEDQLRCIGEIKQDMERPSPMDRLLCGDVGFGKTEVALRAAFKCICDGKQCAILVPTTILAWQHYQTALRRMEGMPVTVEVLSRFRTPRQQTQIPRTLNMAMSGLRDMSTLDEAPADRSPVQTYVVEFDNGLVLDAIRRELRRGGQVYYLHNKVESIDRCAARLAAQLPDARVAVAHGKMDEETLSEVWQRLLGGEIDLLVCTTIIETGVDVPNVNTLIIEDADRMGLAQLHQLRGRVGRSTRRAYAYLTFTPGKVLSEIAQKRLEAIREFTEFGSGFRIAMRDLEIRGAGNLLGGEQHGHMDAVGYDMYIKLLTDAIAEEKGEAPVHDIPCTVDLPIGAHIPEAYIGSLPARLGIYRRIADIRSVEDARDVTDELIDRFGEPPASVQGLISVALLRNRCAALGFSAVEQKGVWLRLFPARVDPAQVAALSASLGKLFRVNAGAKPFYEIRSVGSLTPTEILSGALDVIEKAV